MNALKLFLFFYLLTHLVLNAFSSDFHTFTDVKGRQMQAKITRVSGEDIYIERKDGMTARVDLSVFSEADQAYIKEWAHNALLESDIFDVRFSRERSGQNEYRKGGVICNEYNMHYDVVITNQDYDNDFEDIKVEYLILKFEDQLAADKRRDGVMGSSIVLKEALAIL